MAARVEGSMTASDALSSDDEVYVSASEGGGDPDDDVSFLADEGSPENAKISSDSSPKNIVSECDNDSTTSLFKLESKAKFESRKEADTSRSTFSHDNRFGILEYLSLEHEVPRHVSNPTTIPQSEAHMM